MHDDAESIALELYRAAKCDPSYPTPLLMLVGMLGLTMVPNAPAGCRGASLSGIIRYDGTNSCMAHELGHYACKLVGLPMPHHEGLVVSVGARLTVPGMAFRGAMRSGMGRIELARAFRVSETCAGLRIGEVTGEGVAIIAPTHVRAAGDWPWPAEDLLRRMVKHPHPHLRTERLRDDPRRILVRLADGYGE